MREVILVVYCDVCDKGIQEETEGSNGVSFTVRGEQRELDMCNDCLGGSFLQEARPVVNRKTQKRDKEKGYLCGADDCTMSFTTHRGMKMHHTLMHAKEDPREA
jgi:hypothetical protein